MPQTAAIDRTKAKLEVQYDGEPKFKQIEGTGVEYAINTSAQVLRIKGKYYACDDGVWFVSDKAQGPWAVAESVPMDEISKIPPSEPVYNTKYVYIYESTPEVVSSATRRGTCGRTRGTACRSTARAIRTRRIGDLAATRIRRRGACTSPITPTRAGAWASPYSFGFLTVGFTFGGGYGGYYRPGYPPAYYRPPYYPPGGPGPEASEESAASVAGGVQASAASVESAVLVASAVLVVSAVSAA